MDQHERVMSELGEVKGMLQGVGDMIRHTHETTNRRIDDLIQSNDKRITAIEGMLRQTDQKADEAFALATQTAARVDELPKRFAIAGSLTGGSAGALMGVTIELIRAYLGH